MTYLGVDVDPLLREWWTRFVYSRAYPNYGSDAGVVVVVLDPTLTNIDWRDPLSSVMYALATGDKDRHKERLTEVTGMLRHLLRTGHPSADATTKSAHLLAAGDYPRPGALRHRGLLVAASGIDEPDKNVALTKALAEKVYNLHKAAATLALERAVNWLPGNPLAQKYLGEVPLVDETLLTRLLS